MSATNDLVSLYAGENRALRFTVTENDGVTPTDLTGLTLRWAMAARMPNSPGYAAAVLTKLSSTVGHMTIAAPASGVVDVNLLSADTLNLTPGQYEYQLWLTTAGGESFPVATGKLALTARL